ncbi:MAG: hypothetical protein E6Q97_20415 [Desulfurellales bacterium]|nr:MAG: hypothetical protein E6Q97_20415 [Desulfurellales bacterium]
MSEGNDKSVPKTYRVYDEEMTFVEYMMTTRQIPLQSEYVRMLLWQDAILHAPSELLDQAQHKRQTPKQLALTFTPRVSNWEKLRVMLAHYVNAEMSAGCVPPAWTELFATQTATSSDGTPAPPICCSNPIAATIGFLLVCESCKTELSPLGAKTIVKWRATCAARAGNTALASEYERQATRYDIAYMQENDHDDLRLVRRRHALRYAKGFFEVSDEDGFDLMKDWPFVDRNAANFDVCTQLRKLGGKAVIDHIVPMLEHDKLNVESALEQAQDDGLVQCEGKLWKLLDEGLKVALSEHDVKTCKHCKRPLEHNVFNEVIACDCKLELPELDEEVAPVAVSSSSSSKTPTKRPAKRKSKVVEEVAPVAVSSSTCLTSAIVPKVEEVLVRRCRNKGATKNVAHLVRASSVQNKEWSSLCGFTLYPRTFPRANSTPCTLCENALQDSSAHTPLRESDLPLVTNHYRVWDKFHDCAHTLAHPVSEAKYAVCGVWVANTRKSALFTKAPENVSDCPTCAKMRGNNVVEGDR